mmetsp:Transcript_25608/g.52121  ORF Transcript_25608/g.52121 Transcript_25608/m.52121 type:complete len:293 (+) Transcript_25608:1171-2049(+)
MESLETPAHKVCRVRIHNASKHSMKFTHLVDKALLSRQCATHHIIVSREVLRPARESQICVQRDGAVIDGGGERCVDATNTIVLPAQICDFLCVNDAAKWIRNLFREEECCSLCRQDLLQAISISWIDDGQPHPHLRQNSCDKLSSTAIAISCGNNVTILVHQRQQHRCDSVHPRSRNKRILSTLQRHNLLLQRTYCWVTIPAVLERFVCTLVVSHDLRSVTKSESCSLDNGCCECIQRCASFQPSLLPLTAMYRTGCCAAGKNHRVSVVAIESGQIRLHLSRLFSSHRTRL